MDDKAKVSVALAVKALRENMPAFLEHTILTARIQKAKYDALIKEGFTKEQAIELTKGQIL